MYVHVYVRKRLALLIFWTNYPRDIGVTYSIKFLMTADESDEYKIFLKNCESKLHMKMKYYTIYQN